MTAQSNAFICGRSLTDIFGFESRLEQGSLSFVSFVCCQLEVSVTVRSLIQGGDIVNVCLTEYDHVQHNILHLQ